MVKILIADNVSAECAQVLEEKGFEVTQRPGIKEAELASIIGPFDGVIVRSGVKITREVIQAAQNLRIIGRAGVGVDNIDVDTATKRRITVINAPSGNSASAAELTWGLLLALCRKIAQGHTSLTQGRWERKKFMGIELEGKTLGIVGAGRVGSKVAIYAKAFGMRVIIFDPYLPKEKISALGAESVSFSELLSRSDFVTIHIPSTPETKDMFGEEELRMMKPNAMLINTSRGDIVNENALIRALEEGKLAGAALDVFKSEPPPKDHPLFQLPQVVLTPHLGASTEEAQRKVATDIAHQFVSYFETGTVKDAVNVCR
jgi:D-3-phosphoglycerate dehydrogenase